MNWLSPRNKLILKDRLFKFLHIVVHSILSILAMASIIVLKIPFIAYVLILLSKWKIVTIGFRFWLKNIRQEAVDIIVALSVISFLANVEDISLKLVTVWVWIVFYFTWVIFLNQLKSKSGALIQATLAQTLGVSAILVTSVNNLGVSLIGIWFVSYFSANHFLSSFKADEPKRNLTYIWTLFATQLAWVLLHWRVSIFFMQRLVLLQLILFVSLGLLYLLHDRTQLKTFYFKQIVVSSLMLVLAVLLFTSFQA